ncbi:hypothetical protein [Lysobacter solisilvae (ex Woo and Kim 2020)]|uniref:Uncharacterized protein n=1 Tax=Agrilutibacter terrestris TaxID=2865112 RepID=A0A7H0FUX3_9GAMM|nr:hypothetical protein [Lysobacter terrestris]QNP39839.1 hypothetical protein H8B22_10000 [Lysobacter terrestris]
MGWPGTAPEGANQADSRRFPNRAANKNPIRFGRTGLDAVTRLRVGELRFRKGQDANVHRFIVAGGGPFLTVRCRDRSTHFIPQESSAGRNLITVFCHVNKLTQFFFRRGSGLSVADGSRRRSRAAAIAHHARRRCAQRFDKAHKKRHFAKWETALAARTRNAAPRSRMPPADGQRPFPRSQRADDRQVDLASHKSVCAKTAQTFSADAGVRSAGDDARWKELARACGAAGGWRMELARITAALDADAAKAHPAHATRTGTRLRVHASPRMRAAQKRRCRRGCPAGIVVSMLAAWRGGTARPQWSSSSSSSA